MNLTIWHPIPVDQLGRELALQEHFNILQVAEVIDAVSRGEYHELQWDPEVHRWINHVPALYARYRASNEYFSRELGVEVFDLWQDPPLLGGSIVYPNDPEGLVLDLWASLLVRSAWMDY